MRIFETGATRDSDDTKLDYEGYLSPLVLERYAKYMQKNSIQADGKRRDSDNWQKGIPLAAYMKSMWRHFMDVWMAHRHVGLITQYEQAAHEEALCALLFNVSGYLHELLLATEVVPTDWPDPAEACCDQGERPPYHYSDEDISDSACNDACVKNAATSRASVPPPPPSYGFE